MVNLVKARAVGCTSDNVLTNLEKERICPVNPVDRVAIGTATFNSVKLVKHWRDPGCSNTVAQSNSAVSRLRARRLGHESNKPSRVKDPVKRSVMAVIIFPRLAGMVGGGQSSDTTNMKSKRSEEPGNVQGNQAAK